MRKGFDKTKSCDGKITFPSLKEANEATTGLNIKAGRKRRVEAYQCEHCGAYHFGHTRMKKEFKLVNKVRRQKKRLDPREYAGIEVRMDQGYCLIKQIA